MNRRLSSSVVAVVAAITMAFAPIRPAEATVLAHEDFGVHAFDDVLSGDGFGWGANWTSPVGVGQYSGLGGDPTPVYNPSGGSGGYLSNPERTGRNLDTSIGGVFDLAGYLDGSGNIGADGKTIYIGFAWRASPAAYYYGMELYRDNDSVSSLEVSRNGADTNLVNLGGVALATPTAGTEYYVLKIVFGAGSDTASAWYNPTLFAPEGTPDATVGGVDLSFDRIGFGVFVSNSFLDFDDIRVGTTYADVVGAAPVPAPAALPAGLAMLGLTLARRRR